MCCALNLVDHVDMKLACIQHRLCWGRGLECLRFLFRVLVSNIDRFFARVWCLLSAAFAVNSMTPYRRLHCQSLLYFVDRHDEEAAGKIASSLAISLQFPEQKEKEFFSRVTQRRWRSCKPQNDNRSHHPSDLRRSTVHAGDAGWRVLQDIRLHACLKAKVRTPCELFWLAFDWCKQVK